MEEQLARPAPLAGVSIKLVIGLFFAILGVLLTLDNFNVIHGGYFRYWPVVFIAAGLVKLGDVRSRGFAVAMIVLGSLLVAMNTRLLRFSLFDLWPLLLIAAGAVIVTQALGFRPQASSSDRSPMLLAILGNRKITIDSRDFTGGRIVAFMGGCFMDLSQADIQHGPAVIEMLILMGGVDMRIADGWEVIGDVVPFMGGVDVKTRSKRTGRQLVLRGFVMMGGVEVRDAAARTR
jgi:predicted membrane protein